MTLLMIPSGVFVVRIKYAGTFDNVNPVGGSVYFDERYGARSKRIFAYKQTRLRLDPQSYEQLWLEVLQRDGWRCRSCGSLENLQIRHSTFRSQSGHDSEQNLITLCAACHAIAQSLSLSFSCRSQSVRRSGNRSPGENLTCDPPVRHG
jgi:hypothetical protein